MAAPKPPAFDTLSLHAGQHPDPVTGSRAVPIHQTTSYVFQDADHAAALFNLERAGHIYTRISNPTIAVLEERLAALENGVGAVCTASGMAAMHLAIVTLLGAGDHIVASASLYGGTINLLTHTLPRFGITTTFVKPRDLDGIRAAIKPNTKLVIGETIGNPGLEVLDIPAVAKIAHDAGIPLLIDNTFATPYLARPIEMGADIVMNSITKWIGGHGIAIGGVIVDGGHFDWEKSGKFPTLTTPYAGYHGIVFSEEFGPQAFIMRAAPKACAISAPAFHPPMHSRSCKARRRCMSACSVTSRTPLPCWLSSPRTRPSSGCCILRSIATLTMRWRNNCCRAEQARSSLSASRADAMPDASSSNRSNWSAMLPMSGTPRRWSSIPPAPRINR